MVICPGFPRVDDDLCGCVPLKGRRGFIFVTLVSKDESPPPVAFCAGTWPYAKSGGWGDKAPLFPEHDGRDRPAKAARNGVPPE